jgi:hypothetical protein
MLSPNRVADKLVIVSAVLPRRADQAVEQSVHKFSRRPTVLLPQKTVALSVIKDRRHGRRNLRRPQRDPSAGSSRHAQPTIQELLQALFKADRLGAIIGITIIGGWA